MRSDFLGCNLTESLDLGFRLTSYFGYAGECKGFGTSCRRLLCSSWLSSLSFLG